MASSSASILCSYDVFLSFRGDDTRRNFTDHLYSNLVAYGIHTFRDDEELEKGGPIASDLSKAIEESMIFLIIFSKNYAQSSWCLNELVKIMERITPTQKESRAIPVFYHVEPSDVRKQLGSFGDAFACHERDEEKKEMIQKWRSALKKAAHLSGYHLDGQEYEAEFIQEIREDVIKRLDRKPLYLGDNIVGMSSHLEQLRSLIKIESNEVRMIGIYGTGGIGKTTIAMAVYNDISSQFDGSSFLRVAGEKSEKGLLELQKKLLRDILKCEEPKFDDPSEGINVIKGRLHSKRVLIILDDVDEPKQLENLARKCWFREKSRVIITTKDTQLLAVHGVKESYEVPKLNDKGSAELLSWFAFKQNSPILEGKFESLSNKLVKYADGLPIALKVIGQFLYGRTELEWESALYQLEKEPNDKVYKVLKVSYEKLSISEQNIFLDIACFFKGRSEDWVSRILGEGAKIGISVLCERCLVTISENKLEMHDLLQRMGWEIVRQECVDEPGKWSRLWDPDDVDHVLRNKMGTEAIKGLLIRPNSEMNLTSEAFEKMNNLQLLMVEGSKDFEEIDEYCAVHNVPITKDFKFPFYKLRYLKWDGYHLEYLPENFYAKYLLGLSLRRSSIKQLRGGEGFDKLKVMDLSLSRCLIEIPSFSSMPNLEILLLKGCRGLESLPSDFYQLKFLQEVSCYGCSNLRSFPEVTGNMRKLKKLNLSETAIKEMPSSIGLLSALEYLNLSRCQNLGRIPNSMSNLSSLKTLDLLDCPNLSCEWGCFSGLCSLPVLILDRCNLRPGAIRSDNCLSSLKKLSLTDCNVMEGRFLDHISQLSSLQELCLDGNHFSKIPTAISRLSNLQLLDLTHCRQLLQIPGLPPHLRLLDAHGCSSSSPSFLPFNSLLNCFNSDLYPSEKKNCFNSQCQVLESQWNRYILDCSYYSGPGICIIIPGEGGIPEWICDKREGSEMEIELPENWYKNNDFLGFVISFLYVPNSDFLTSEPDFLTSEPLYWTCRLNIYGNNQSAKMDQFGFRISCSQCDRGNNKDLSTVWVVFYPKVAIEGRYRSRQWTHIKVSFAPTRGKVKECGAYHIDGCHPTSELPTIHHPPSRGEVEECEAYHIDGCIHSVTRYGFLRLLDCENPETLFLTSLSYSDCVGNLRRLNLGGTPIEELPSSIQHLRELRNLNLEDCNNLVSLPQSICHLKFLEVLSCSGCSQLKAFPEIQENMENLRGLDLGGTAIEELPSSIQHLRKLRILNLKYCNNLVSLPESICHLKFLEVLSCSGCSQLKAFPEIQEIMGNLRELNLGGTAIEELPSSIQHLRALEDLYLEDCNNLVSLPESICHWKFLEVLSCSGCSQLKAFPEIQENMGNLRRLNLGGTAIEELPSSIQHLRALENLNLEDCNNLGSLLESICHLKSLEVLSCSGCSQLKAFPEIQENMGNLRGLDLGGTAIEELPSSIQHLRNLRILNLKDCNNLVSLPESICHLKSLEVLSCFGCSQLKAFPEIQENMENLRGLDLGGTAIEKLPSSIQHLRELRILNLEDCNNLVSLPESICHLKFLMGLSCSGCSQLKAFPNIQENMENLTWLNLGGTAIEELPSSIQHLRALQNLYLEDCNNLVSLPESICHLKLLRGLSCSGCSQLKAFSDIQENMENFRWLNLGGTAIEELPTSIQHLRALRNLI